MDWRPGSEDHGALAADGQVRRAAGLPSGSVGFRTESRELVRLGPGPTAVCRSGLLFLATLTREKGWGRGRLLALRNRVTSNLSHEKLHCRLCSHPSR